MINGDDTKKLYAWLKSKINMVEKSTDQFIKDIKTDPSQDLNDYTILFPTNAMVDKMNRDVCEYNKMYTEFIPAIRCNKDTVEDLMKDGIPEVKVKSATDPDTDEQAYEDCL
jgi:hypothetical protein